MRADDPRLARFLRVLLTEGPAALDRAVLLDAPPHRRLRLLSNAAASRWLRECFPAGLPDDWLPAGMRWATWYREARDGR